MKKAIQITLLVCQSFAFASVASAESNFSPNPQLVERGRYLIRTVGCNDCHTPQYTMKNGEIPEQKWLIGDSVGWMGPWGTTYSANIRHRVAQMSEEQWIEYAQGMKARPPMPFFAVNAMTKSDLKAIYHFVKSLGDSQNPVPEALEPGKIPKTPYINMSVVLPYAMNGQSSPK